MKNIMIETDETIWSECSSCKRSTKHHVLGKISKTSPVEYYHEETIYFLLECKGCTSVYYRTEHHDYESFRQIAPDDYEHDISVEVFPHQIKDHNSIDTFGIVPSIVESVYKESLLAIQEGAFILAGLALRATIEAICNDKGVKGKNLQVRINSMSRLGMISKSDAERLHAIRFMGNDAAHQIKKVKEKSVLIDLKIIEHLLLSVYVFEIQVKRYLETVLTNIEDTLPVLQSKLTKIDENSTFTLNKWLGSSRRRVLEKLDDIEANLIIKIEAGELPEVCLTEKPEAEQSSTQWYKKLEKTGD